MSELPPGHPNDRDEAARSAADVHEIARRLARLGFRVGEVERVVRLTGLDRLGDEQLAMVGKVAVNAYVAEITEAGHRRRSATWLAVAGCIGGILSNPLASAAAGLWHHLFP